MARFVNPAGGGNTDASEVDYSNNNSSLIAESLQDAVDELDTKKLNTSDMVSNLNGLADVVVDSPADNEMLAYDSSSGNWINQTSAEIGVANIVNTDGNPGTTIYVGATDPSTLYTLEDGDVWIETP